MTMLPTPETSAMTDVLSDVRKILERAKRNPRVREIEIEAAIDQIDAVLDRPTESNTYRASVPLP